MVDAGDRVCGIVKHLYGHVGVNKIQYSNTFWLFVCLFWSVIFSFSLVILVPLVLRKSRCPSFMDAEFRFYFVARHDTRSPHTFNLSSG